MGGRPSGKLIELDALRGIAALMVFCGHFCEGLVPAVTRALHGTPLFAMLNGPAAVIVFFVLSGFVLTLQPLQARRFSLLAWLMLKRWPRLAGPVVMAGLAYWLAATLGAFPTPDHIAVAQPLPHPPPYLFWGATQHDERLDEVLREALVGTFLRGSALHNAVLWTMHWEFLGSFLTLGLAAVVLMPLPVAVRVGLFAGLWWAAAAHSPWLIAFPIGVVGAVLHRSFAARIRISNGFALAMALAGVVLLSWDIRTDVDTSRVQAWVLTESLAAVLWMAVALYNPAAKRLLFSRAGALAGRMSFAFYLIHLLVLMSLASWLYILLLPTGPGIWSGALLFLASLTAAVVAATPLMLFDQWWIRSLGRMTRAVSGVTPAPARTV